MLTALLRPPRSGKKKTMKLVFVAYPLSRTIKKKRAKIVLLVIRISNVTCSRHDVAEKLLMWMR